MTRTLSSYRALFLSSGLSSNRFCHYHNTSASASTTRCMKGSRAQSSSMLAFSSSLVLGTTHSVIEILDPVRVQLSRECSRNCSGVHKFLRQLIFVHNTVKNQMLAIPTKISISNSLLGRTDTSLQAKQFITFFKEIKIKTMNGVSLVDITAELKELLNISQCTEGVMTVLSKHSTVSVTINELEGRLVDDTRQFLLKLAPPSGPYLHNDLDYRSGPADWPGGDIAWRNFRATQPPNAHSHLIAMLLGTSESIPIHNGELTIGTYQNVIVVDADGPKSRTIAVQICGSN